MFWILFWIFKLMRWQTKYFSRAKMPNWLMNENIFKVLVNVNLLQWPYLGSSLRLEITDHQSWELCLSEVRCETWLRWAGIALQWQPSHHLPFSGHQRLVRGHFRGGGGWHHQWPAINGLCREASATSAQSLQVCGMQTNNFTAQWVPVVSLSYFDHINAIKEN